MNPSNNTIKNFVSKITKHANCCFCSQQFLVRDSSRPLTGRCLFVLSCGHSACESCIIQRSKINSGITCSNCDGTTTVEGKYDINDKLAPNMYLLGNISYNHGNRIYQNKGPLSVLLHDSNSFSSMSKRKVQRQFIECEECCREEAQHGCKQCSLSLCGVCWDVIHRAAKKLKLHEKGPLGMIKYEPKVAMCPIHESQKLEFYCETCQEVLCPHCAICNHREAHHISITLQQKNERVLHDLKEGISTANETLFRLEHTLKKVQDENCSKYIESSYEEVEREVNQHYSRLHGLLQYHQLQVLEMVNTARYQPNTSLQAITNQLEKKIEDVSTLLEEARESMRPTLMSNCNLLNVIERLGEVSKIPCHLMKPPEQTLTPRATFNFDLLQLIPQFCTLTLPTNNNYELKSTAELPEGYEPEPIVVETSNLAQDTLMSSISGRSPSATLPSSYTGLYPGSEMERTSSRCSSVSSFASSNNTVSSEMKQKPTLDRNTTHTVYVNYVKSPGEFYVILSSDRKKLTYLDQRANSFVNAGATPPTKVEEGELYLAMYSSNSNWYRCSVLKIQTGGDKKDTSVLVKYIDYGNTELLSKSRLRYLPDFLRKFPSLAHKCTLHNLKPRKGEWCKESARCMENMLNKCVVNMRIMDVTPDCLEVDLSKNAGQSDGISSFRDTMLYFEYACLVRGKLTSSSSIGKQTNYLTPMSLRQGDECFVTVSCVVSPDMFFVMKDGPERTYYDNMVREMQDYYQKVGNKYNIYNPYIEMPCAAYSKFSNGWTRGQIKAKPGNKLLQVFYIDEGRLDSVPWSSVRHLDEKFFKLTPQAIKCSLAEVLPRHSPGANSKYKWKKEAVQVFERLVKGKVFKMFVMSCGKNLYRVLLYDKSDDQDLCVNTKFVATGSAFPTGAHIRTSELPQDVIPSLMGIRPVPSSRSKQPTKSKTITNRLDLRPSASSRVADSDDDDDEVDDDDEDDDDNGNDNSRLPVEVLRFQTPSLMYLSLVCLKESLLKLKSSMKKVYHSKSYEDRNWELNDRCAVKSVNDGEWYRAAVHDLLDNDVVVFLKDYARLETVPKTNLRNLEEQFCEVRAGAFKCHLVRVEPGGGVWPGISCEFLDGIISKHKLYMTIQGEAVDFSLPIDLWIKKKGEVSALAPITIEWTSLSDMLIDQGLAIPVQIVTKQNVTTSELPSMNVVDENEISDWKDTKQEMKTDDISDTLSIDSGDGNEYLTLTDWKPAVPLTDSVFSGVPTYVDNYLHITFHLIEDKPLIDKIRNKLTETYGSSKPDVQDQFWSPGQLCVVRFHMDRRWYRGKILKVHDNLTYEVLFVDFGNVEVCQVVDLRKKIKISDIPVLGHKCQLSGIVSLQPDGLYPDEAMDKVHGTIVDRKSTFVMVNRKDDPPSVNLRVGHIDVATTIVHNKLALFSLNHKNEPIGEDEDDEDDQKDDDVLIVEEEQTVKVVVKKSVETVNKLDWNELVEMDKAEIMGDDLKRRDNYAVLEIPDDVDLIQIEAETITSITSFSGILITEDKDVAHPSLIRSVEKSKSVIEEVKQFGSSQPRLINFETGQPCCALYSEDNLWYRGQVVKVDLDNCQAKVFYVDYGNYESVQLKNVRQLKSEWLETPVTCLEFKIHNVNRNLEVDDKLYIQHLSQCLFNNKLYVRMRGKEDKFFIVDVLADKNNSLVYQGMIDEQLMILTTPDDEPVVEFVPSEDEAED